ncbi:LysR family transcriptional regulator [Sphingorhabdus soli]|uniref:LysR family transcriptional regulator n=2 Tax=Flavisphingopyxis soli TaxID=2601267 RepID=A0A5C6UMC2_9SPHN|nr:LysR family transcriptional regulator [Sphingorhabdus soli]
MSSLPSLAAIRVFEAAARLENFSRAAEELGMSQAAVSYQIRTLEQALGVSLFRREKGRVMLSAEAADLSVQTSAAFATLRDAFDRLRDEDASQLTVNSFSSFANLWLGGRIGGFQLSHPDLAVRLTVEDRINDFARDDIDVAVRGGLGDWPGLHAQLLMRSLFAPMASPAYVADHGPFDTPEQIAAGRLLSPQDRWWATWFAAVGLTALPPPAPGIRFDSQSVEGSAALAGQGIALLNPVYWDEAVREGRLVQLFPATYSGSSLWVVCREHQRNQAKIKAFRDWAVAEAERGPWGEAVRAAPQLDDLHASILPGSGRSPLASKLA